MSPVTSLWWRAQRVRKQKSSRSLRARIAVSAKCQSRFFGNQRKSRRHSDCDPHRDADDGRVVVRAQRMPQMSEERFDRIDATLQKLGARFDTVDKRLDAFDARFDAVDKRLDAIGASAETLKIKHEAMIQQFKGVSEGVGATNERLDRFERQVNDRFDKLTVDVRMVLDNHEVRIHDLEQR
ncbi:MAG TPA: hypothetical protein VG222_01200 [Vicinamibacterales bacterium]|nr:hypothetical protein [Vicinamibacterales bacterium]